MAFGSGCADDHQVHVPGDQVGDCLRGALVGHVEQLDVRRQLEAFKKQKVRAAGPERTEVQFTRAGLRAGDEIRQRLQTRACIRE